MVKLGVLPLQACTILGGEEILRVCFFENMGDGSVFPSRYKKPDGDVIIRAGGRSMKTGATESVTKKADKEETANSPDDCRPAVHRPLG